MPRKIRSFGRSATLRKLLLDCPAGATADALLGAGQFDCTHKQLHDTLKGMCAAGQVSETRKAGARLWILTDAMRRLMLTPDLVHPPTHAAVAKVMPPSRSISTHSTTIQHKEAERQQLAAELARFRAQGGQIEVLDNTPLRPESTRRQINDAAAIFRSLDFCKATL